MEEVEAEVQRGTEPGDQDWVCHGVSIRAGLQVPVSLCRRHYTTTSTTTYSFTPICLHVGATIDVTLVSYGHHVTICALGLLHLMSQHCLVCFSPECSPIVSCKGLPEAAVLARLQFLQWFVFARQI